MSVPSRTTVLVVIAAAGFGCKDASAPSPTPPISEQALLAHITFLADDSLYGRGAGTPAERRAAEYVRDQFVSYDLEPGVPGYLQVFSTGGLNPSPDATTQSQNVIGVLPGRGALARQWVVIGAHYDHLGWRRISADSVVIFNGADDNASGTALLMEMARYLTHYFTRGEGASVDRRSIMFHAYGSEELGLVGSFHFCGAPTVPMDSVAAMVNFDMVGRHQQNGLTLIGTQSASFWTELLPLANTDGLPLNYNDKYMGGSDQLCFYQAGRPVIFFFTGLHAEYHTPFDDVPLIDGEGMVDVAGMALRLLHKIVVRPALGG